MRIIFSRKGFDSAAGGGPSPIVNGRPVSLPIPAGVASKTTYDDLGLGELATAASRGKISGRDLCHHDPMFLDDGTCLFGQCGAAQTHLANQNVGIGDVFVFFGLFREDHSGEPHHRIFGYLKVSTILRLSDTETGHSDTSDALKEFSVANCTTLCHPHAMAMHSFNDVIYCGPGQTAKTASAALRLTVPDGPPSLWQKPAWLKRGGLTYHDRVDRWFRGGRLRSVARGQEFVADVGKRHEPREWLEGVISEINRSR